MCRGGRHPGQIIAENHAVDLRSGPMFDLFAKELVQPGKQRAKVLIAVANFADGSFPAAQLAKAVQWPHFAAGEHKSPRAFADRVDFGKSGRLEQLRRRLILHNVRSVGQRRFDQLRPSAKIAHVPSTSPGIGM